MFVCLFVVSTAEWDGDFRVAFMDVLVCFEKRRG